MLRPPAPLQESGDLIVLLQRGPGNREIVCSGYAGVANGQNYVITVRPGCEEGEGVITPPNPPIISLSFYTPAPEPYFV